MAGTFLIGRGTHTADWMPEFCKENPSLAPLYLPPPSPSQGLGHILATCTTWCWGGSTSRKDRHTSGPSTRRHEGSLGVRGCTPAGARDPPRALLVRLPHKAEQPSSSPTMAKQPSSSTMHQTKLRCYMCALLYPRHALPKPPGRQGPWPCPASRGAGQGASHLPRLEEHTPSSRPGPRLQGAGAKVTEVSNRFWGHWVMVLLDCFLGLQSWFNCQSSISRPKAHCNDHKNPADIKGLCLGPNYPLSPV